MVGGGLGVSGQGESSLTTLGDLSSKTFRIKFLVL